jgi:coenzyme F420 hydrogenase subunit beta
MEAAAADGAITLESDITMRDMDNYQPHQVTKKQMVWARYAGLRASGQLFPQTQRLRIRELALENGFAENLRQAKGTKKRVRNGRNCEPTPVAVVAEDASQ